MRWADQFDAGQDRRWAVEDCRHLSRRLEVHCADGSVALVRGTVDRVPWLAGETAQRVVIVDAAARPLPANLRGVA